MDYKAKICYNKRNGQAIVFLSKKKLELLKKQRARYLRINEKDLLWGIMPLTKKGKKILNVFVKQYGKEKGRNIFYAFETKRPDLTGGWRHD